MRTFAVMLWACLAATTAPAQQYPAQASCPSGQCPLVAVPPAPAGDAGRIGPGGIRVDARAIVRVTATRGSTRSVGSGTLVDADTHGGLVLTCAHLFRDAPDSVRVAFADERIFEARLVKVDQVADLAALAIAAPGVEPVEIAARSPERGDYLVSCGYGGDGRLWCNRGQALGYVSVQGSPDSETLELTGAARHGDSGGPVLDCEHRLVAVLFGTNGRVVNGTFCGRIRRFLAGLSSRFRARRQASAPGEHALPAPAEASPSLAPKPPRVAVPNVGQSPPLEAPKTEGDGSANVGAAGGRRAPEVELPPGLDGIARGADALGAAAEPWISARLTALLISLGLPGGVAGLAAGATVWLVMRRGARRLQARLDRLGGNRPAASAAHVDAAEPTDTADPAVVERHHNRYVAYETTAMDKAWAAAHAHVGQKYPGAIPYLKIAEGVKDQLLSGNTDPQVS